MAEIALPLSRRMVIGETGAADIRLLAPRARFSLRVAPALLAQTPLVAGFSLDMAINRCSSAGGRTAMRLGPDEWLLSGPESEAAQIARDVEAALDGLHHALFDVSHRQVALSVAGPGAAAVINAGCPLDLGPTAFPAGSATRTLLGKAEIILSRPGGAPAFKVECVRSFAPYVRDFLLEAAQGLGAPTEADGWRPRPSRATPRDQRIR
jgi:sarcosine oxidase subunit gamma